MNEIWCLYGALDDPRLRWFAVRLSSKTVAAGSAVANQSVTQLTDSQLLEKHESLELLDHRSSIKSNKARLDQCKGNGEVRVHHPSKDRQRLCIQFNFI